MQALLLVNHKHNLKGALPNSCYLKRMVNAWVVIGMYSCITVGMSYFIYIKHLGMDSMHENKMAVKCCCFPSSVQYCLTRFPCNSKGLLHFPPLYTCFLPSLSKRHCLCLWPCCGAAGLSALHRAHKHHSFCVPEGIYRGLIMWQRDLKSVERFPLTSTGLRLNPVGGPSLPVLSTPPHQHA